MGASALANRTALAALNLGSNITVTPFVWPYDATAANGGAGIWSQAAWNQFIQPALLGCQGGGYSIFQFTSLLSGTTLVANYAANAAVGGSGQNYTPLGGTAGTSNLALVVV